MLWQKSVELVQIFTPAITDSDPNNAPKVFDQADQLYLAIRSWKDVHTLDFYQFRIECTV